MIEQVAPSQLKTWVTQATTSAYVLDVREPWELQTASIDDPALNVIHIPMNELPKRLAQLNPNDAIACLCHHGGRSMQVAQFLAHNGFTHVVNISGGIHAWSAQVDPSVPTY